MLTINLKYSQLIFCLFLALMIIVVLSAVTNYFYIKVAYRLLIDEKGELKKQYSELKAYSEGKMKQIQEEAAKKCDELLKEKERLRQEMDEWVVSSDSSFTRLTHEKAESDLLNHKYQKQIMALQEEIGQIAKENKSLIREKEGLEKESFHIEEMYELYVEKLQKKISDKENEIKKERDRVRQLQRMKSKINLFSNCDTYPQLLERKRKLLQIYHPDNPAGDADIAQQINNEFEKLENRCQ